MNSTEALGNGLPPQLPDEQFHDYMQRLYALQGGCIRKGNENKVQCPPAQRPVCPVLGLPEETELEHHHWRPVRHHSTPKQRTMLNITAVGRLGKDPELRTTQSGQEITSFSLGVSVFANGEKQTEWIRLLHLGQAWRGLPQYVPERPAGHGERQGLPQHLDRQRRRGDGFLHRRAGLQPPGTRAEAGTSADRRLPDASGHTEEIPF